MPARGSAQWLGELKTGSGTFSAGESLSGGYTFKSRFDDGPGSNPEQLIAAAHASCFSMALAALLARESFAPTSISTDAVVTLQLVEGAQTITKIELTTTGVVENISAEKFNEYAQQAKVNCIVSRALGAVGEITLSAHLAA